MLVMLHIRSNYQKSLPLNSEDKGQLQHQDQQAWEPCGAARPCPLFAGCLYELLFLPRPLPARPRRSWLRARPSLLEAQAQPQCPPWEARRCPCPSSLAPRPLPQAACRSREGAAHRRAGTRAAGGQGGCWARCRILPMC